MYAAKRRGGQAKNIDFKVSWSFTTIRICYQLSAGFRQISVKNKVVGEFFDPGAMFPAPQSMCPILQAWNRKLSQTSLRILQVIASRLCFILTTSQAQFGEPLLPILYAEIQHEK